MGRRRFRVGPGFPGPVAFTWPNWLPELRGDFYRFCPGNTTSPCGTSCPRLLPPRCW
nr:MAG TPA: hypothetical protein [Bacteriophage sp.]